MNLKPSLGKLCPVGNLCNGVSQKPSIKYNREQLDRGCRKRLTRRLHKELSNPTGPVRNDATDANVSAVSNDLAITIPRIRMTSLNLFPVLACAEA